MTDALTTMEAFQEYVDLIEAHPNYKRPRAFAVGIAYLDSGANLLDTYFPLVNYEENYGTAAVLAAHVNHSHGTGSYVLGHRDLHEILYRFAAFENDGKSHANIDVLRALSHRCRLDDHRRIMVVAFLGAEDDDEGPQGVPDVYLRLHLLSHRRVLPNTIGASPGAILPKLPNVAWTSEGPVAPTEVSQRQFDARLNGSSLRVYGVDKLPHMLDYVVPSGVRIADSARVRLGAYVGDGTTVMPAGFINFNAGTLGKAMIEGRVSQGVIVGDGSDLGGAASTQGTMSGGSNVVVSIGERTLIGALAGVGISLGDDCIVAAGVYVMPTTDVFLRDTEGKHLRKVKAYELSGENGLMFVQTASGAIQAKPNKKAVELNPILHKN